MRALSTRLPRVFYLHVIMTRILVSLLLPSPTSVPHFLFQLHPDLSPPSTSCHSISTFAYSYKHPVAKRRGSTNMPALPRRTLQSSLPTLLGLSKIIHHIPKRSAEWVVHVAKEQPVEPEDPPGTPAFWWKLGLSACLVLAGGVFAG